MNRYSMIVQWSDEDQLFLVTIPEFSDLVVMPCTHGKTREEAIRRLQRALAEFNLAGIKSNIVLLRSILEEDKFLDGSYTTQFLEKDFKGSKDIFHFVDDRAFLLSAVIEAYEHLKKRDVRRFSAESKWKKTHRWKSMR